MSPETSAWVVYRRLLKRARRYWPLLAAAGVGMVFEAGAAAAFTWMMKPIVDETFVAQNEGMRWTIPLAIVSLFVVRGFATFATDYGMARTGRSVVRDLREDILAKYLRLPSTRFDREPVPAMVSRLNYDTEQVTQASSDALKTILTDSLTIVALLAVMFWYSWVLSLVAVGLLLLIVGVSLVMVPVFRQRLDRQFLLGARNQAFLTEYLSGMATVKALQMEPDVDKRYGGLLAQYLQASFATRQLGNTYQVTASALEQTMTLAILIVGAWTVMHSDAFTVGMLVAFQMFASRLSQPLMRLVGLWQEFQQASIAVKRLADVLDMPTEPVSLVPQRAPGGSGAIEVQGLGFRYSERHPWLYQGLSLTLPPGQLTVLMGPSGCGKSTLAKLLLGFHLPEQGRITINGRDIRHLAANELRAHFGVVPQETVLFSGTVLDNLLMAHPHARFEDAVAACRAAEIHDVIEQLPQGYQTEIGERGTGLSGGQPR